MSEGAWVHLEFAVIVRMTEKAFLIRFKGHHNAEWIPFSQIEGRGLDYTEGDRDGTMRITEWLAKEKGLAT